MICPRCGTDTTLESCPKCSAPVNKNRRVDYSKEKQEENILASFIGSNYPKILCKPSNFAAGFLRPFYLSYRKQYLLSIIDLFLEWIPYFIGIYSIESLLLYRFGFFLFWASFFNPIYIWNCKRKIEKYENLPKEKLRKKGGADTFYPVLLLILILIGFLLFFILHNI